MHICCVFNQYLPPSEASYSLEMDTLLTVWWSLNWFDHQSQTRKHDRRLARMDNHNVRFSQMAISIPQPPAWTAEGCSVPGLLQTTLLLPSFCSLVRSCRSSSWTAWLGVSPASGTSEGGHKHCRVEGASSSHDELCLHQPLMCLQRWLWGERFLVWMLQGRQRFSGSSGSSARYPLCHHLRRHGDTPGCEAASPWLAPRVGKGSLFSMTRRFCSLRWLGPAPDGLLLIPWQGWRMSPWIQPCCQR